MRDWHRPERLAREGQRVEAVIDYVELYRRVLFDELVRLLQDGMEVRGSCVLHLPERPNTVLWWNASEAFVEAVEVALESKRIELYPVTSWVDRMWLGSPGLPVAERPGKADFKRPHWLPVGLKASRR
jgi:hypothetical protein